MGDVTIDVGTRDRERELRLRAHLELMKFYRGTSTTHEQPTVRGFELCRQQATASTKKKINPDWYAVCLQLKCQPNDERLNENHKPVLVLKRERKKSKPRACTTCGTLATSNQSLVV
jgi:hypothetical protein